MTIIYFLGEMRVMPREEHVRWINASVNSVRNMSCNIFGLMPDPGTPVLLVCVPEFSVPHDRTQTPGWGAFP